MSLNIEALKNLRAAALTASERRTAIHQSIESDLKSGSADAQGIADWRVYTDIRMRKAEITERAAWDRYWAAIDALGEEAP